MPMEDFVMAIPKQCGRSWADTGVGKSKDHAGYKRLEDAGNEHDLEGGGGIGGKRDWLMIKWEN